MKNCPYCGANLKPNKKNYLLEKILSCSLFILSTVLILLFSWIYYRAQTMTGDFTSFYIQTKPFLRLLAFFTFSNFIALFIYFRLYLSVFSLGYVNHCINGIILCLSLLILMLFNIVDTSLFFALLIILSVLAIIVGWSLARFKGDYIGGLSILGYCICISAIIMPLWIVVPLLMYKIFDKAENIKQEILTEI